MLRIEEFCRLHFFLSSFPTIPGRIFLLWKDYKVHYSERTTHQKKSVTKLIGALLWRAIGSSLRCDALDWTGLTVTSLTPVADNRETVRPGAAVALIFGVSKDIRTCCRC